MSGSEPSVLVNRGIAFGGGVQDLLRRDITDGGGVVEAEHGCKVKLPGPSEVRQVLQLNRNNPATYCPAQDMPALFAGLMNAFRHARRDDRPRFWVAINSRPFDPALPPADSGTPEAVAWQQAVSSGRNRHYERRPNGTFYRTADGRRWEIDLNAAVLRDPSARAKG